MSTLIKTFTLLFVFAIYSCDIYAQNLPDSTFDDSIEYDNTLMGGMVDFEPLPDYFYDKDSLFEMQTIELNINQLLGLDKLIFGEVYILEFDIGNIFQRDVRIMGFSRPCICITPDWHRTKIPPGGVGFVRIKFTATILGPHQKLFTAYIFDDRTMQQVARQNIVLIADVKNVNNNNNGN